MIALSKNCKGFALIWVLMCMGLITVALVSALSLFLYEKNAVFREQERLRAETSLYAALAVAQSLLCKIMALYPDSCTVWEERLPGLGTPGTALHILQRSHPKNRAQVLILPLVSGAQDPTPAGINPFGSHLSQLCNLNQSDHWIGGTGDDGAPLPIVAPWISLEAGKDQPVLARYAFFIEDESFKLNLQEASLNPSAEVLRAANDISLRAALEQLPQMSSEAWTIWENKFIRLREQETRLQHLAQIRFKLQLNDEEWRHWKFLYTIHSESLNRTRKGLPRVNCNTLFTPILTSQQIRQQLDEFISAVQRESPYFGQRFYRDKTADLNKIDAVSPEYSEVYLNKLAANVRDLLIKGPNPTRILNQPGYSILPSNNITSMRSVQGIEPNPFAAIGKKKIPYLQEYALVTRLLSIQPAKQDPEHALTGAQFEMTIDHLLEFWNLSDTPIYVEDLGPGARVIIRNQPLWDLDEGNLHGWGIPPSRERDIEIPLADFRSLHGAPLVFLPGQATVLTTFSTLPPPELFPQGIQFFFPSQLPQQKFVGVTYRTRAVKGTKWYELRTKLRNSGNADYETEYLLINDRGWIDGFNYLPILTNIVLRADTGQPVQQMRWNIRSSGLQGNESGSDWTGDPRTLNEQLLLGERNLAEGKSAAESEIRALRLNPIPHTRFLETARPGQFRGSSSFGKVQSKYLNTAQWPDPVFPQIETNSESCVSAAFPEVPFKSIGEFGHVFDPIRDARFNLKRSRGGGRTLRIGQPEFNSSRYQQGVWDGDPLSPSREWAAWRLCDIFSVTDQAVLRGAVNINGVLRQDGAILKALLRGFRWNRQGAGDLRGAGLEKEDIQLLVSHFQKRLRRESPYEVRGGPFFERGEISEIDLFQSKEAFPNEIANPQRWGMAQRSDRVREEICRYLIEAITTKGRVFSVYCVGQAVRKELSGEIRVLASRRGKFTFRLVPGNASGQRLDQNHPLISKNKIVNAVSQYRVELLDTEYLRDCRHER